MSNMEKREAQKPMKWPSATWHYEAPTDEAQAQMATAMLLDAFRHLSGIHGMTINVTITLKPNK